MLSPRLSGCLKCASITDLLADIDCKLDQLSTSLYNNVVFSLNNSINATAINSLLIYKRILMCKLANDQYACNFSINAIASKVKLLVGGVTNCCAKRKKLKLSSTTSSTTTVIPISTTTTTSSSTTVILPRVNIKDFGAVGNGVTNDTQSILDAIAYAESNNIFIIFIPIGTYMITRGFPLIDGMTVYGTGSMSLLKMVSGSGTRTDEKTETSVFVGDNAYSLSGPSSYNSTSNITIKDLAIDLQKPAGIYNQALFSIFGGVRFINPINCTIDNVTILNQQVFGIGLYATQNGISCVNNTVQNCNIVMEPYWYLPGLGPNDVPPANISPRQTSCIGIELSSFIGPNNNGTAIYLTRSNPDYIASKTQNNTIKNNTISGGSHGISISNSIYNTIRENSSTGCSHRGIITAACSDYNTYENNIATNIGSTGIHFSYNCEHNIINNNTVNTVFGVEGDGIKSYVNCNYNTFTNNNVSNVYITGIRVAHGANNNIIRNNIINGNSNSIQYGVKILANTLAQYNSGLTFGDQLTADNNDATLNSISNVNVGILVGDEKNFPPTNRINNVITPNTFTNVVTNTISS